MDGPKMIKSIKKNKYGIALMVLSSICVCVGQLFWKLSSEDHLWLYLFLGFSLYGMGAIIMIIAYRFGSLSVLQPILSMNYVLTVILAVMILNESMSLLKLVGILIIIAGVILISGGDEEK
jgi:undecaprenyl phosphate-alpha-L-ara4N flippase subunit ArnE